jgi:hypothetical protein
LKFSPIIVLFGNRPNAIIVKRPGGSQFGMVNVTDDCGVWRAHRLACKILSDMNEGKIEFVKEAFYATKWDLLQNPDSGSEVGNA